jgi:putative peptidoglycan lipid II flippase
MKTVKRAAMIVMIGMIVSRLLGYGRYKVIAYFFGRGWETDAFIGAFAVPDLLYILSSGGALGAAFIPLFSGLIEKKQSDDAWRLASGLWNVLMIVVVPSIVLGMVFAPQFTDLIVPGFRDEPETRRLCFEIVRIIFPMVIFTATAALCNAVLQSMDHYTTPAVAWSLHNIGIIAAAFLLHRSMGIKGLAFGVLAGAFSMVAIQVPVMMRMGMRYYPTAGPRDPNVKKALVLFLPAMLGLSISQINLFVLPATFGSMFSNGSVTSLQYGVRLLLLPLGVFGNALAMAAFPTMSAQAAGERWNEFHGTLIRGIRSTFVFSLPCTAGFILLGLPIVRLLFGGGEFTLDDCIDTKAVLMYYAIGLVGHTAIQMISRGFYSLQDTRTPFWVAFTSVLLIIIPMGVGLVQPVIDAGSAGFKALVYVSHVSPFYYLGVAVQGLKHQGVALAISIATLFNMIVLLILFQRRRPDFDMGRVWDGFARVTLATAVMSVFIVACAQVLKHRDPAVQVLTVIVVGGAVFFAACKVFKVPEVDDVVGALTRRFKAKK